MTDLQFTIEVPIPPESVVGALTNFTDGRPEIWPQLDAGFYRVDELGPKSAVVREGQLRPRLWAIEEYDWSKPNTVVWTVRESNFCKPGSFMSAHAEPAPGGGSRVDCKWNRTGVGVKGKIIVGLIRATGGRPLAKSLRAALVALEGMEATD